MPANVADLVAEHIKLDDWLSEEGKRFEEHVKPYRARVQEIKQELLALSLQEKWANQKTEAGTAYRSTVMSAKVVDREALLDFALENWETIGNSLLLIQPQKDAVKEFRELHPDKPLPGVDVSFFTRINVRR